MRILGYRLDDENEKILLFSHRYDYYVRYKGEDTKVALSYEMVDDGTFSDNVREVPYFVMNGKVYPLASFESLNRRGIQQFRK